MPTPAAAAPLRHIMAIALVALTERLMELDRYADNLAIMSCCINTAYEMKSFIQYLADQRQCAWTRYTRAHRIALQASGFT